jgi:hypothetical protein
VFFFSSRPLVVDDHGGFGDSGSIRFGARCVFGGVGGILLVSFEIAWRQLPHGKSAIL